MKDVIINVLVTSHCEECGCESHGNQFCKLCAPYMNVSANKGDSMNNREDVRFLSDLIQEINEGSKEDTTAVYRMQKAYESWMKENSHLLEECSEDKDAEVKEVGWEEGVSAFYDEIMLFREEMGENVSAYWTRKERHGTPMSSQKADELELTPVSGVEDAVEPWGDLEVCARLFTNGITCGTSFADSFRNIHFEMGMNPNEVHDGELNIIGTEQAIAEARNSENRIAWKLGKDLEVQRERTVTTLAYASENVERLTKIAALTFKIKLMECFNAKEVSKMFNETTVRNTLRSVCLIDSDGVRNMPYAFNKFKSINCKGMSYNDAIALLNRTKCHNEQIVESILNSMRDFVNTLFPAAFANSRNAFYSVDNGIAKLLENGNRYSVVQTLKKADQRQRDLIKVALDHANSKLNTDRFTTLHYNILRDAGFVAIKTDYKANDIINGLNDGSLSVSDVEFDLLKRALKAAYNNKANGNGPIFKSAVFTEVRTVVNG